MMLSHRDTKQVNRSRTRIDERIEGVTEGFDAEVCNRRPAGGEGGLQVLCYRRVVKMTVDLEEKDPSRKPLEKRPADCGRWAVEVAQAD